jgi:hypothetical protein
MGIFHFQYQGDYGWEAIGAGVGDGDDPIGMALAEVGLFYDGPLPAGSYQVIESRGAAPRWEAIEVGVDGKIVDPRRSV